VKLKLVIVDLEMSPRVKRRLLRLGLPIALVLGGSALAYANVPKVWNSGDKLLAADLNGNFSALDTRITTLEGGRFVGVVNGKKYSVGATSFVKSTSMGGPNNNGTYDGLAVGGYSGAKTACEAATSSASAHMCTGEELARSAAVGIAAPSPDGWYAGLYQADNGTARYNDCNAYTTNSGSFWGSTNHSGGNWTPAISVCSSFNPILCCD
jgi:hypothetical protein